MGFCILKIWQILKHFTRSFHQAKTSYFWECTYKISLSYISMKVKYVIIKVLLLNICHDIFVNQCWAVVILLKFGFVSIVRSNDQVCSNPIKSILCDTKNSFVLFWRIYQYIYHHRLLICYQYWKKKIQIIAIFLQLLYFDCNNISNFIALYCIILHYIAFSLNF